MEKDIKMKIKNGHEDYMIINESDQIGSELQVFVYVVIGGFIMVIILTFKCLMSRISNKKNVRDNESVRKTYNLMDETEDDMTTN